MKLSTILSLILALSASSLAIAQTGGMKDMDMKGMDKTSEGIAPHAMRHQATGVVKAVDSAKGKVTLAHGPVKSLKWPAMTMRFAVKDKTLFDQFAVGQKVKIEFVKQDLDYVMTAVNAVK